MRKDIVLINLSSDNICVSGGADGSDILFGEIAEENRHSVIHFSFDGHKSKSKTVKLTTEQLDFALPFLKEANKTMGRKIPYKRYVLNLLLRNYYQIAFSQSVYAVSTISKGKVDGGTGWAVTMFIDRHEGLPCDCFVFDQDQNKWFKWNMSWEEVTEVPIPTGIWAGIGTRKLNDLGTEAIKNIFKY